MLTSEPEVCHLRDSCDLQKTTYLVKLLPKAYGFGNSCGNLFCKFLLISNVLHQLIHLINVPEMKRQIITLAQTGLSLQQKPCCTASASQHPVTLLMAFLLFLHPSKAENHELARAQPVMCMLCKAGDQSSCPRTHKKVEGKN